MKGNEMGSCCNNKACELEALRNRQSSTLKIVLIREKGYQLPS